MHAGIYGPSVGDGYLYAKLLGPQSYLIQTILERWRTKHPEIKQTEIQLLIWAIIARTSFKKMDVVHKIHLLKLLDSKDLEKYAGNSIVTEMIDKFWGKVESKIPNDIYAISEAEHKLRVLYYAPNITYEEFERIAVLIDKGTNNKVVRNVPSGSWSYHPDGYFVRYFPSNYSNTRVDVYIPLKINFKMDSQNRIDSIYKDSLFNIKFTYSSINSRRLITIRYYFSNILIKKIDIQNNQATGESSNSQNVDDLNSFRLNNQISDSAKETIRRAYNILSSLQQDHFQDLDKLYINNINYYLSESANNLLLRALAAPSVQNKDTIILNLTSNVAVLANTTHQRLAIANDTIPKKVNYDCPEFSALYDLAGIVNSGNGIVPFCMEECIKKYSKYVDLLRGLYFELSTKNGHAYLAINPIGVSNMNISDVGDDLYKNIGRIFPNGAIDKSIPNSTVYNTCIVKNHIYALLDQYSYHPAFVDPSKLLPQVQVTDISRFHFTFTALPHHLFKGTALHGIFKDECGNFYMFQQGRGSPLESTTTQVINLFSAKYMWMLMAVHLNMIIRKPWYAF